MQNKEISHKNNDHFFRSIRNFTTIDFRKQIREENKICKL